jgi:molybdate transport system ATP-binding protein
VSVLAVSMAGVGAAIEARFRVAYSGFTLDVDLSLPGRGVSVLFGHSGSGKTTLLRAIAGLERVAGGRLVVGGEVWQDGDRFVPIHRRPLGYVFQEASLFPHLSVRANVDYGLRRARAPAGRLSDIVELLGIGPLLDRRPDRLSGGERSRVAIARALVTAPRLLLMDEPLAALDDARKAEFMPYLERLHRELQIPVVYVTHALDEVARLADHLVLLANGRVEACGPAAETLIRSDLSLARGDDASAILDGTVGVQDAAYRLTRIDSPAGYLWVAELPLPIGSPVRLRVLARDISLALAPPRETSILNVLPATVSGLVPGGPGRAVVSLAVGGATLLARITEKSVALLGLVPGKAVFVQIKGVAVLR